MTYRVQLIEHRCERRLENEIDDAANEVLETLEKVVEGHEGALGLDVGVPAEGQQGHITGTVDNRGLCATSNQLVVDL